MDGLAPTLKVGGSLLATQWLDALTSARVDLGIGLSGRTVLRFVDFGFALSTSEVFAMGEQVVVSVEGTELMTGEVTAMSLEQSGRSAPELVVTIDDRACRLVGASQNRAYINQSYVEVVKKLLNATGLTLSHQGTTGAMAPYWLQAGSNLHFLNELCTRLGLMWWVEGAGKLVLAPVGSTRNTLKLALGEDLTAFSVRATSTGPESVTVRGWNPARQEVVSGAFTGKIAKESNFVAGAAGRGKSRKGTTGLALTSPPPIDAAEAKQFAHAKFAEAASAAVVATGTGVVNGAIGLTDRVDVVNAGPASGTYTVSRIEHTYTHTGFETRFTAGPVRPSAMVDLLGGSRPSSGLDVGGVHAAVVSDVKDPNDQGRVKVSWKIVDDLVESAWGRMVMLGAGKQRGMVFFPEVGDEVLIAFEQGDTRRPVILGGLFSSVNTFPATDDLDENRVKFRRITSRLGHVVELADGTTPGEQHILLTLAGKKHKIRLGEDKLEVVTDGTPISLTNGNATLTLADNGDVTIDGNNIVLKAKAEIKVTAANKVTVKGSVSTVIQGAQVELKADAMAALESGGPMTVKGATVAIN